MVRVVHPLELPLYSVLTIPSTAIETVPLETAHYQRAIAQMASLSLPGGGFFDALIAQAALKISAEQLLTLNPSHFTRLDPTIAQITKVPQP